jgi:hypothetical protein
MQYGSDGFGSQGSVWQWSTENYSFALSYYYPINPNLKLGIETNWIKIGKTEDDMISIQLSLMYKMFKW